jgi:hypothetical protein
VIKKHVAFPEQLVKPDSAEYDDETDEELLKKKKNKRKTKSKKDVSVESSEEDGGQYIKTRRTQSKKDK